MPPRQKEEQLSPFIPVGGREFIPGDELRDDPVRAGLVGRVLAIKAMTGEGLIFVEDPNNPNGQIGFYHTQGSIQPPLNWLQKAAS